MAAQATVIDASGKKTGTRELPDELFGGEINVPLMHQIVEAQRAAIRSGTASTKTRSEVRGGGQKPWRQKGTGRARHGSIRSPIWVGGGAVFGPKPRDHSVRVPKKMKAQALRSALASRGAENAVWILDGFGESKTKAAAACLSEAGIEGKVLLVVAAEDESTALVHRAFRNLADVTFCYERSINTHDVLRADTVIFTNEAFDSFTSVRPSKKVSA
jgi:large subunit ribosomal protein L4